MGPNEGGRGRDSLKPFKALILPFLGPLIIASRPPHGLNLRTLRVELGWMLIPRSFSRAWAGAKCGTRFPIKQAGSKGSPQVDLF
jgi:hypothetical protein